MKTTVEGKQISHFPEAEASGKHSMPGGEACTVASSQQPLHGAPQEVVKIHLEPFDELGVDAKI